MKGTSILGNVRVRGFTPPTHRRKNTENKRLIRDKLFQEIRDLETVQRACKGKQLSLDSCFYLYGKSGEAGRTKKDLENLLKLLIDTLPVYMDQNKTERGLGIIEEKNDELIFEIHASKMIVASEAEEGLSISISEWQEDLTEA